MGECTGIPQAVVLHAQNTVLLKLWGFDTHDKMHHGMAAESMQWDDAGKTADSREQNALLESEIKASNES